MDRNTKVWIERMSLVTDEQRQRLNATLVRKGFEAGERGDREPGIDASLSYWHGWRCGAIMSQVRQPDAVRLFVTTIRDGGEIDA